MGQGSLDAGKVLGARPGRQALGELAHLAQGLDRGIGLTSSTSPGQAPGGRRTALPDQRRGGSSPRRPAR